MTITVCACIAVAVWSWWQSPAQRVRRLVYETAEAPAGIWLGSQKSQDAIDEEFNRLGSQAVDPLIDCLQNEDSDIRRVAALYLGVSAASRAVPPLIRRLSDPDESVRVFAAGALGKLGDPRAIEPLKQAALTEDVRVSEAAREALDKIQAKQADESSTEPRNSTPSQRAATTQRTPCG